MPSKLPFRNARLEVGGGWWVEERLWVCPPKARFVVSTKSYRYHDEGLENS